LCVLHPEYEAFFLYDAENYAQAISYYEMGAQTGRHGLVTSRTKLETKLLTVPKGDITVFSSYKIRVCTNEIGNLHYNNLVIHVYRVLHSTF
jgi:hypothetical protein